MMTAADYEQWKNLPHYIVRTHFNWAFPLKQREFTKVSRLFDYDELVQEANLGLIEAWDKYDANHESKATFITYASTAIIRKVARFIDANRTPVTTRGWQKAINCKKGADVREKIMNALSCTLFSEYTPACHPKAMNTCNTHITSLDLADKDSEAPEENLIALEFHDNCIKRLRAGLTKAEFKILIDKFSGKSNAEIGSRRGYTRECARQTVGQIMLKATSILIPELRDEDQV